MKIAFVGLGKMGTGMARNLLRAGHELIVYNRTHEKTKALAAEGSRVADSPAAAAQHAEAVITMLADDHAVEEATFGDRGIVAGLGRGAVHISCSTISTALARRLAAVHESRGQDYLSVPVFGRPDAAESKRLVVVAAGASDLIERFRPIFDAIGRQTFVAGSDPADANVVKLCGNFMILSMLETFAEAFATLRKSGVDPHKFLEIIQTVFGSPVYANYGRIMADEQFEPAGFAMKLGLKDVRLVLAAAEECASPMPIASVVRDRMLSAMAHGQAELDWSSLARISAKAAALQ